MGNNIRETFIQPIKKDALNVAPPIINEKIKYKNTQKPIGKNQKELKLTPECIHKLINGDLKDPYIKINGVTHYKYNDVDSKNVVIVNGFRIHKDAATAFKRMMQDAARDGINLTIVSGIRDTKYQKNVFRKKGTSSQILANRVRESAPSGYSEHHTGYAMDLNSTNPNDFKKGGKYYKVYDWLKQNAHKYGFEQSFPANNSQGLIEEAWHWRFVGTAEAKETFADARAAAKANGQKIVE